MGRFQSFRMMPAAAMLVLSAGAASAADAILPYIEQDNLYSVRKELTGALAQLDRDAASPRSSVYGHSALRSKGIIIVGGKIGPSRPGASPAAKGIIIINSTPGTMTALRRLQRAVQAFEREAGPNSPKVAACRRQEGQCLQNCRTTLRRIRLQGRCSCIGVRAQCLDRSYRLDRRSGEVRFGDGVRGRRLPSGK